jgi:polyisoprenoid-binding protein YceI
MNPGWPTVACLAAALGLPVADRAGAGREPPPHERYVVDAGRSRLTVETRTSGLSSMFGHDHRFDARTLTGEASFAPGGLERAALDLTVEAESLWLMEDVGEADYLTVERALKQDVLESAKYPRITFRGRAVSFGSGRRDGAAGDVRLAGELFLHGVRRRLTVPASVTFEPGRLRTTGAVEIRQTDFKIVPFVFAGGTVRVQDKVLVSFDIVANEAP